MGRKKRLIKISGINVFPTEIEKVVKELPFINECACIEYRVKGKPFIKVLVEGEISDAQKQAVISHVAKRMSHWNIPRCVECVKEFPRTKIGKIDIKGLNYEFGKDTQGGQ
ncbi:MAG: acyl--CoA ligase [Christensenella sp.]|nr:MAG: acyl--CoA ligase [Christensenella sp.]